MNESKRVLAVVDPTATEQPALERSARLARALGVTLDIFVCDYDQYLSGERYIDSAAMEEARRKLIDGHLERLERLKRKVSGEGLDVAIDARWDHPLDEGIVRKVAEAKPLLVAKDTHYHSIAKRTIFSNTDWNLIRTCPAPLLLVKPRALAQIPIVVASVDPTHEHDKPAKLDHAIMTTAKTLTAAVRGSLHVFHAFDPALAIAATADTMATPVPVTELIEALERRHRDALEELLKAHGAPSGGVHLEQGPTQDLLVRLAEELRADFVVMGAVSRSGLRRLFIGSTAERVLDRLPCDLLIVKPDAGLRIA